MPDELEPKLRPGSAIIVPKKSKFQTDNHSEMSEELYPVLNVQELNRGDGLKSKFADTNNDDCMSDELEPKLSQD